MNMHPSAGMELLTTAEAAAYLRLKERKLYELVAERMVPCTKVTGKWLFPRADLDRWLLAGMARPHGWFPPTRRPSSAAAMIPCCNGPSPRAGQAWRSCRREARRDISVSSPAA